MATENELRDALRQLQGAIAVAKEMRLCARCDGRGTEFRTDGRGFKSCRACPDCGGTGFKPHN